ncbi:MAG: hypothetical protein IT159_16265 [Bryobacterales bacterium]|nr:hypothetical protein [Bryobacterales bacterium]
MYLLRLVQWAVLAALSFAPQTPSQELIVCGWDEVFILDMSARPPVKTWSWKAKDRPELPDAMKTRFGTTDDCKPVDGGKRILITSSGDGVALVERATGQVLFHGTAGGAHSAELLPGGRIAVAASTSKNERNNSLVVFDVRKSGQPLFETELASGHGVVWDARRQLLWALSGSHLRTYRLVNWEGDRPELAKVDEYPLPEKGGHDLSPLDANRMLAVTTVPAAFTFDRDKRTFAPYSEFAGLDNVKCISMHAKTGRIAWTRADPGFWWTATLRFLNPEGVFEMKGERLYKVRWVEAFPGAR